MPYFRIHSDSKVKDVYNHPVGRDVIDKLLLQVGKSQRWITNPLVKNMKLKTLEKMTKNKVSEGFWDQLYWLLNTEKERPEVRDGEINWKWWKEATFYQIYPRSFHDSNADGVGDIRGIIEKLDYLKELGVDALWLSPIYDSPNDDMGYDIRDYKKIMAEMGSMEDFDELLEEVHKREMRLIMDLVVNHTSDEHEWFRKALSDPSGEYANYYYFVPGEETQLPNNWVSFFGGNAWRWFPEVNAHALHLFSSKQMDLNWEYEPLRQKIYAMIRWWLEKGVDGFRLDVINYISKRKGLPDGNETIGKLIEFTGIENYFYGPKLHEYLKEMNQEAFAPFEAFSVAETPGIGVEMGKLLTGEERHEFDLIFNFDHLESPGHVRFDDYQYDLNYLKKYYMDYQNRLGSNHWMSVFWENHDNPRMISKVTNKLEMREPLAKMLLTLLLTMRGTPFLYQGQELGEVNQDFHSIDEIRDVESIQIFQEKSQELGTEVAWNTILAGTRDHARVPMAWDEDEKNGGFSEGTPWIERKTIIGASVAKQMQDPHSILHFAKALLRFRRDQVALRKGDISFHQPEKKDYFCYTREFGENKILVEMNLSDKSLRRIRPITKFMKAWSSYEGLPGEIKGSRVSDVLQPYEAMIYIL